MEHCATGFTHVFFDLGTPQVLLALFCRGENRPREALKLAQGHTAGGWEPEEAGLLRSLGEGGQELDSPPTRTPGLWELHAHFFPNLLEHSLGSPEIW